MRKSCSGRDRVSRSTPLGVCTGPEKTGTALTSATGMMRLAMEG